MSFVYVYTSLVSSGWIITGNHLHRELFNASTYISLSAILHLSVRLAEKWTRATGFFLCVENKSSRVVWYCVPKRTGSRRVQVTNAARSLWGGSCLHCVVWPVMNTKPFSGLIGFRAGVRASASSAPVNLPSLTVSVIDEACSTKRYMRYSPHHIITYSNNLMTFSFVHFSIIFFFKYYISGKVLRHSQVFYNSGFPWGHI